MIERLRRQSGALLANPILVDGLVVSLLTLSLTISLAIELGAGWLFHNPVLSKNWWVALALTVPMVLVAAFRRRAPVLVWAVASAAQFTGVLIIGFETNPWPGSFTAEWAMYVGVYAVAARKSWRWAVIAVLAGTFAFFPITAKLR